MSAFGHAAAIQLVLEEVLLSDVHLHPYELLGWEGIFGTAFMAVALPVLHELPGAIPSEQGMMTSLPLGQPDSNRRTLTSSSWRRRQQRTVRS